MYQSTSGNCCGTSYAPHQAYYGHGCGPGTYKAYRTFYPKIDVSEDENNIYFEVELPGFAKEDVKILVNDKNVLTIEGERKAPEQGEAKKYRQEMRYGQFTRSFELPDNVDADKINAFFDNGLLTLTLPKKQPEQPKEREIGIS